MDEGMKVPYYFPPQRYIPRLGGGGGSAETPQSGFFHGISDAIELYMQLKQAKEDRQERASDRKERQSAQRDNQDYHNQDLTLRRQDQLSRDRAIQAQREHDEEEYAGKFNIGLDPGVVRQKMEEPTLANIPSMGPASGLQMPVGPSRQEAGLSDTFRRGTEARVLAEKTRTPQTFEGGIALPSPASERYDLHANDAADRLRETKIRVAEQRLSSWQSDQARYALDKLNEYRAQNKFPVPGGEQNIIDRARADYERVHTRPHFDPEIESALGNNEQQKPQSDADSALDDAIRQALPGLMRKKP